MKNRFIFLTFLLMGCDSTHRIMETEPPPTGAAKIVLVVPATIPSPLVETISYQVTGPGMSDGMEGNFPVLSNHQTQVTIEVPAGSNRRFEVSSYTLVEEDDTSPIITYSGNITADVEYGEFVSVFVLLERVTCQHMELTGRVPVNATATVFRFSGPPFPTPFEIEIPYPNSSYYSYEFIDLIPTGKNIDIYIYSYENDKSNVIAEAYLENKVIPHWYHFGYSFTMTSSSGNVELIARFPD